MSPDELRCVNCKIMEEAVDGLMKHGFNHEDWNVFSQALDNEMHICKIEESMEIPLVIEMKNAYEEYSHDKTEKNLHHLLDATTGFIVDMKRELSDNEKFIVKNKIKVIYDSF